MVLIFLKWILVLQIIGIIGFPLSYFLFKNLRSVGIGFSKPIGIIILCSSYWLISNIPVFPIGYTSLIIWSLFLLSLSLIFLFINRKEFSLIIKQNKYLFLTIEVIFFLVFFFWIFIRFLDPNIVGTEKPMDFMILNSMMNFSTFPPTDLWYSGEVISYYYFGYWIWGIISILSNIAPNYTYNLSIATVAALTSSSVFGLISMMIRENKGSTRDSIIVGIVTLFFVLFCTNFHIIWETLTLTGFLNEGFLNWLSIDGLTKRNIGDWYLNGGWWRSSRIINFFENGQSLDYTISEFPLFSFILGDLHPHLMSIPFFILSLATVYILQFLDIKNIHGYSLEAITKLFLITLIVGSLGFINGWDFPVIILIFFIFYFFIPLIRYFFTEYVFPKKFIIYLLIITLGSTLIFFSQYYLHLQTQVQFPPILPVKISSRIIHFFTIWGVFILIIMPLFLKNLILIIKDLSNKERAYEISFYKIFIILFVLIFVIWIIINFLTYDLINFSRILNNSIIIIFLFGFIMIFSRNIFEKSKSICPNPEYFFNGLIVISLILLLGVEMFRVNDFFGNRMNTIFKIYYQVWILFSFISGYIFWKVFFTSEKTFINSKTIKIFISSSLSIIFVFSSYYLLSSIHNRTNGFNNPLTLDGTNYLKVFNPLEYELIDWVKNNTEKGDVILESVGQDYTKSSLISTFSGRPTVLGWTGHEHQWRGDYSLINSRNKDVIKIYTSENLEVISNLLNKYDVKYIIIGEKEILDYQVANILILEQLGDVVFNEKGNKIIKLY